MSNPGPASTSSIHPSNLATNQAIRLLAVINGASVGTTGDTATFAIQNTTSYCIQNVAITNANKDVSTAALAIWTGPAGTGTEVVTNAALKIGRAHV